MRCRHCNYGLRVRHRVRNPLLMNCDLDNRQANRGWPLSAVVDRLCGHHEVALGRCAQVGVHIRVPIVLRKLLEITSASRLGSSPGLLYSDDPRPGSVRRRVRR